VSSELVVQGQDSQVLSTASNVAEVLAAAPVHESIYSMEEKQVPKKRGRKSGSKNVKAATVVDPTEGAAEPIYNTRLRANRD
jgi:hypothetical protein